MLKLNIPHQDRVLVFHGKTNSLDAITSIKQVLSSEYTCKVDLASPYQPPSPYLVTVYRNHNTEGDESVLINKLFTICSKKYDTDS